MVKKIRMEKRRERGIGKRGQVAIFIIIAILVVGAVLLYFLWIRPSSSIGSGKRLGYEGCVEDAVKQEMENLGKQAGFIEPEFYRLYKGEKVGYLCYTNVYHKGCVIQKPFLKQHFEDQLLGITRDKINRCLESAFDEAAAQGAGIDSIGAPNISIEFIPGKVNVNINAPVTVTKETAQQFANFDVEIISDIYDILMIATSILQYEVKYGDSDVSTLMFYYPNLKIQKMKLSEGTTIYNVENKVSKTKFQFASRSYAWPAGYAT